MILVQGQPLESQQIPLTGTVDFNIEDEFLLVKKIALQLDGNFKLKFMQIGTKKNKTNGVALKKEESNLLQVQWDNLLVSSKGLLTNNVNNPDEKNSSINNNHSESIQNSSYNNNTTTTNNSTNYDNINQTENDLTVSSHTNISNSNNNNNNSSLSLSNPFKLTRSSSTNSQNSSRTIPINPIQNRTPVEYNELTSYGNGNIYFKLYKGYYSLPFQIQLPNDVPETIEGLQSASILYTLESYIYRKHKKKKNKRKKTIMDDKTFAINYDPWICYKYLRILRTLTVDNFNINEEMNVSNTLRDKLQYEIKISSRAIPIGTIIPININIFPFSKNFRLNKISVSLLQYYLMKDHRNDIFDDEIIIFKKSMKDFGSLVDTQDENRLLNEFKLESIISIPDNLRKVTQSCDLQNTHYIQVSHKLQFQILLKRWDPVELQWKNLEIRAQIPIILYISPQVPMQGRLIYYDQQNGNIHFRSGELVDLFPKQFNINTFNTNLLQYYEDTVAPPTYNEYQMDPLVINNNEPLHLVNTRHSNIVNAGLVSNIPTYDEAIQYDEN